MLNSPIFLIPFGLLALAHACYGDALGMIVAPAAFEIAFSRIKEKWS